MGAALERLYPEAPVEVRDAMVWVFMDMRRGVDRRFLTVLWGWGHGGDRTDADLMHYLTHEASQFTCERCAGGAEIYIQSWLATLEGWVP